MRYKRKCEKNTNGRLLPHEVWYNTGQMVSTPNRKDKMITPAVKGLFAAVAAFIICGGMVASAEDSLSASRYLQSGLIGQWDAIENAGPGVHQNEPETWADLTGNHTLEKIGTPVFEEKGVVFDGSASFEGESPLATAAISKRAFTIQMVLTPEMSSRSRGGFCAFGGTDEFFSLWEDVENYYRSGRYRGGTVLMATDPEGFNTLSVVCDGSTATVYIDAREILEVKDGYQAATSDAFRLMRLFAGQFARGTLHSCRLYDRPLSIHEIRYNLDVDRYRFTGALAPYMRVKDGKVQYSITVTAKDGEVSADAGETWAKGLEFWADYGSELSLRVRGASDLKLWTWERVVDTEIAVGYGGTYTTSVQIPGRVEISVSGSPLYSGSYAQDKLIGQWDGIENYEIGTHVENPEAWIDLTGNHIAEFNGTPVIKSDGVSFPTAKDYLGGSSPKSIAAISAGAFTIQMCISDAVSIENQYLCRFNCSSDEFFSFWSYGGNYYRSGRYRGGALTVKANADAFDTFSIACDGGSAKVYLNNDLLLTSAASSIKSSDDAFCLMNTGGTLHECRLYEKALTPDEIYRNNYIDLARFRGADASAIQIDEDGTAACRLRVGAFGGGVAFGEAAPQSELCDHWVAFGEDIVLKAAVAAAKTCWWIGLPDDSELAPDGRIAAFELKAPGVICLDAYDESGAIVVVASDAAGTTNRVESGLEGICSLHIGATGTKLGAAELVSSGKVRFEASGTGHVLSSRGNGLKEQKLVLVNAAVMQLQGDLVVRELDIIGSGATLDLNGYNLKILSGKHKDGKGWADDVRIITAGGEIKWAPPGLCVFVR